MASPVSSWMLRVSGPVTKRGFRFFCLVTVVVSAVLVSAQPRLAKTLAIYVVDVEGGNATLFVSPSGESLLIDAGNGGMGAPRDAGRIIEAARDAGLAQIDHVIITHWHGDHYGGLAELASRIPIRHFIDHGPNVQPNDATDTFLGHGEAHSGQTRRHDSRCGSRRARGDVGW